MGITKTYPAAPFRITKGWGALFTSTASADSQSMRRGLWVVVLGPDGAGKSSVITEIGDGVAAGFAGCDSYHLTALNLHGRQGAKANCDPHGKAERSFLVTLFKLAYLFLLNWVGYLVAVLPKVESGRLVLFDRYFLDCLVDSRRYRIPVSCRWLARLVAKWVPEPDLYLVLDAPASVLRIRKQEVSEIEAERQRWEYRRLADNLANAMIVCADQPRELMLEEVTKRIIEAHLSLRQRILKTA